VADTPPIARRLKAALALAGMTTDELGEQVAPYLHIGARTIERVMQGRRALKPVELDHLAKALGVPNWFLEHGLEGAPAEVRQPVVDELAAVAQELTLVLQRLQRFMLEGDLASLPPRDPASTARAAGKEARQAEDRARALREGPPQRARERE
jgi:transcriptional regulator with XRE-family HTH domain